jgi:hypothetical protein
MFFCLYYHFFELVRRIGNKIKFSLLGCKAYVLIRALRRVLSCEAMQHSLVISYRRFGTNLQTSRNIPKRAKISFTRLRKPETMLGRCVSSSHWFCSVAERKAWQSHTLHIGKNLICRVNPFHRTFPKMSTSSQLYSFDTELFINEKLLPQVICDFRSPAYTNRQEKRCKN